MNLKQVYVKFFEAFQWNVFENRTNSKIFSNCVSHFMRTAKHFFPILRFLLYTFLLFCVVWDQVKFMFDLWKRDGFLSLFLLSLTTPLCVHWMEGGSGRFLTMHVRLMVEPIFMKISPVRSPSRMPNIWVMGSVFNAISSSKSKKEREGNFKVSKEMRRKRKRKGKFDVVDLI